ncbi:phosphopantothenoylcysteine decarboxylase [Bombyx mori]|uniref:Phosphopantothenoylcysteine decarboxylase n=1 Tax=Bombyx mori TaxID=7091 RepID=A0A8R1WHP2_BOMMO|nr:phosphopantothenoylcysteine decarboxylase [Bombyx mori]
MDENTTFNVLVGVTGSVAAIKIPNLIKSVLELRSETRYNFKVRLIVTEHAKHFFEWTEMPLDVLRYDDSSEWVTWKGRGDPVLHIELGKWADIMVIAPMDANTLAKVALGMCDNLVTCTVRAWNFSKPLLFCPAMNTRMWDHPITATHISTLRAWGFIQIPPITKTLMCGDTGVGAMAEVEAIVEKIKLIADMKMNRTQ